MNGSCCDRKGGTYQDAPPLFFYFIRNSDKAKTLWGIARYHAAASAVQYPLQKTIGCNDWKKVKPNNKLL